MTFREIAAVALDEANWVDGDDFDESLIAEDAAVDAGQNKNTNAALEFDLKKHDKRFHEGHYDGKTSCKYREKMAAAMGKAGLNPADVKGLGAAGAAAGGGEGTASGQQQESEAEKKFLELKAKFEQDGQTEISQEDFIKARNEYLLAELGEAEVDCIKKLEEAAKTDGPQGEKAEKAAERILNDPKSSNAQKEGAQAILDARKEWKVNGKTYVDVSGMGFWEGLNEAFKAGYEGKDIVTDWDKMSGRWDKIIASDPKFKEENGLLQEGVKDALADLGFGDDFEKAQKIEGLSREQWQEIWYLKYQYDQAESAKDKHAAWRKLKDYLKEQGLEKGGGAVNSHYIEDGDENHKRGGVTANDGTANWEPDSSFLDRNEVKGVLDKLADIQDKIVKDFAKNKLTLDPKAIQVTPYAATTSLSIPLGDTRMSKKDLNNLMADIQYRLPHVNEKETKVTYNQENGSIDLTFANDTKGNVSFGALLDSPEWKKVRGDGSGAFFLGRQKDGSIVMSSLDEAVHMMIAGQTGAGKSARFHNVIGSLVDANSPDDLQFIMIDPKGVELNRYQNLPHMLCKVVTDMDDAAQKFAWTVNEQENRYNLFNRAVVSSIQEYNEKAKNGTLPEGMPKHLPRLALCVEELADLMDTHGPEVEGYIKRLAQKARAAGIHLILATQRPDAKTLSHRITTNIPTKLGMATDNATDARVIGIKGLENLPMKGPFAYQVPGKKTAWGDGSFLSNGDVAKIVENAETAWKNRGKSAAKPTAGGSSGSSGGSANTGGSSGSSASATTSSSSHGSSSSSSGGSSGGTGETGLNASSKKSDADKSKDLKNDIRSRLSTATTSQDRRDAISIAILLNEDLEDDERRLIYEFCHLMTDDEVDKFAKAVNDDDDKAMEDIMSLFEEDKGNRPIGL